MLTKSEAKSRIIVHDSVSITSAHYEVKAKLARDPLQVPR